MFKPVRLFPGGVEVILPNYTSHMNAVIFTPLCVTLVLIVCILQNAQTIVYQI